MDNTVLVGVLLAALVSLVMMLVVVSIARGFDVSRPATRPNIPPALAKAFGLSTGAKAEDTADKTKKQTGAVVSLVTGLAVFGAVIGIVKNLGDDDADAQITEIAAGPLHGTLVSVRDDDPVVLIVPGSGPTDRDGNGPLGLNTDAYKLLAEGLAEERIATVRIDKRGMFGSAGAGDPNAVTTDAYVSDIHAWIDTIKTQREAECVFLLGHSEGALMASLAAEGRKDVCGLILVAGIGRTMGDVLRQQLSDNPANAPVLDQAFAALTELEAGRPVDTTNMHPGLMPLFAPQVQGYLMSVINIDPVEAVRRADKKTLILQGTSDLQVTVDDAYLLDKAPKSKLHLIDDMNHVLKEAPIDRAPNLATYADPSLPLADRLVRRIEDFVEAND